MADMGLEIYRMSLEWARIEPEEGVFSEEAMNRYIDEIKLLQSYGIKPLVSLHHFSNPVWFENKGGFLNKKSVEMFKPYVRFVAEHLKDINHEYCTINEPNIYAINAYLFGEWLAEIKSVRKASRVSKNMVDAHVEAYKILHEVDKDAYVGFACNVGCFYPANKKNPFYRLETRMYNRMFNNAFMESMAWGKHMFPAGFLGHKKGKFYDFIGFNYYTRNEVAHFKYMPTSGFDKNDLGWDIYPEGLKEMAERYHKMFNADIWITENGTCDAKDAFRTKYIYDHIKAIADLPYVKRYYHWTFMDNFEWKEGEAAKFGLVEYDYENDKKTIRKSGHFYSDMIKNRGVNEEMIKKYGL